MAKTYNDNLENISELSEIIEQNNIIHDLMIKNQIMQLNMLENYELIKIAELRINYLKKQKMEDKFDYQPLINGKINGIFIKTISVHGCQCLSNNQKCTGAHNIHIYGIYSKERLNFNNERKFSINELVKLNYINKLEITVDEDWLNDLLNDCKLADCYRDKVVVYCLGELNWL